MISLFSKSWFIPLASAIASAVIVFNATNIYWEARHEKLKSDINTQKLLAIRQAMEIERLNDEKSEIIAEGLIKLKQAREAKAETITKEVIRYVQSNTNSGCALDDDWVRIADDSTPMPRAAETASGVNGAAAEVRDLGQALRVVTSNYQKCQAVVDKYQAWQEWYRSVSKTYEGEK